MSSPEPRALITRLLESPGLADAWQSLDLPADHLLFAKGDPADALYAVVAGELAVYNPDDAGRKIVLEHIGPGGLVGEVAILDGGSRTAFVETTAPTRLNQLSRADFFANLASSPELGGLALQIVSTRMRRLTGYVEMMTHWAGQVARGDYTSAQAAIRQAGTRHNDPNVDRFIATFVDMVAAVQTREAELKRELQDLRIEIDARKFHRQLSEVTESDFFRDLQANAKRLRGRIHSENAEGGESGPV